MKLKFYRILNNSQFFSFGGSIADVPIGDVSLAKHQAAAIEAAGFTLIDIRAESEIRENEYFVFEEDLVFSVDFVKAAVRLALESPGQSKRFCLSENSFNDRYVLPHSKDRIGNLKYNFYYKNTNSIGISDLVVPQKVYINQAAIPRQVLKQGHYSYDQCAVFIAKIVSPFHLLQINLAFLFLKTLPFRRLIPDFLREFLFPLNSRRFFLGLRLNNKIGRNCRIHSTAIVEGSEIGDNVTIGAYSVVRLSKVASGTIVEEHAVIKYSVLGKNNYISNGNQINGCMTFDEVFLIHGPYQVSIFGTAVAVMAVINCDVRLDQKNIMIETSVGLLDSAQPLLGVAYGHRAKIGGGNIIAPGRIVPNDYHLAPPNIIKLNFDEKRELVSDFPTRKVHELTN